MKRLALACCAVTLVACADASAQTTIAQLASPTPVRSWAGTTVLSIRDPATGRFELATQRGIAAPRALPGIASAAQPFDADIGPGPGGAPVIVFARCASAGHCRLARTTPAGRSEIPIVGAAGTKGFENAPTVWGNRIAFARTYGHGSEVVYTRPLTAGTGIRSTRVAGIPARECDEVSGCAAITHGTVTELELRGTTLAENIAFPLSSVGICGEGQIRLVSLTSGRSTLAVSTICGLSGSTLIGPSLTASHLLYARMCPGDPGGCENHPGIVYRYGLTDHRTAQLPATDNLAGFAATDDSHAIEVRAPETHDGDCTNHVAGTNPPCELALSGPLTFATLSGRA